MSIDTARTKLTRLEEHLQTVVVGKPEVIRLCLTAILAGEHILLEDVPGVGKTLVAKALAKSLHGEFSRIQFTPDLLPSDIVGNTIYNSKSGEFTFTEGPVFSNVVLADEINRAPPRTQSALLEAMSDGQVSVDGETHQLPDPFIVIATQNPYEFEGTYVLPESQLDRFLIRLSIGYPAREDERTVLFTHRQGEPVETLTAIVTAAEVVELQERVRGVEVEDSISDYILDIVDATRQNDELRLGVSTRGALAFYRACQSWAMLAGREFVTPDDVKELAAPVLSHRVLPHGFAEGDSRRTLSEGIIQHILERTVAPS
jgi:MoxR-like ATPase